ncbi:MAG: bifunctional pyr operon transcriptional regulator/uracil phosphoribosyltransferase PyrR [Gammaproteobacteria bacterium]|nr:bifunctional pyr operon transcriptional regulator/uracil phosphoribosyltransferase PyrR [Gammaproteobacteria bacterium]
MTNHYDVDALIDALAEKVKTYLGAQAIDEPVIIGIHTGGAWIAEKLHQKLACRSPMGTLNISFYRDDFTRIGVHPQVKPSQIPLNVEGRDIILVDDVLYTGRTIRAALNEIFDYGRPNSVKLAVLVDRGGRELPIQADFAATTVELAEGQQLKLSGADPLELSIISV